MGLTRLLRSLCVVGGWCVGVGATEVTVIGLPIGGKFEVHGVCSWGVITPSAPCWVGKPFVHQDGGRTGYVALPNPDGRPEWAAHAMFEVSVSKANFLERITVSTVGSVKPDLITNSIKARFGLPDALNRLPEGIYAADWFKPDLVIQQLCSVRSECHVKFISAASWAQQQAEVAARKRKHPVAP